MAQKSRWLLLLVASTMLAGCNGSSTRPGPLPMGPSTPAALYTLSGVISEPAGDAVAGVRVQIQGKSVITDQAGQYAISELFGPLNVELSKDGYEARFISNVAVRDGVNFRLAPTIRIAAGEETIVSLHPNDPEYDFPHLYEVCAAPCKVLRVTAPGRGTLSIRLSARDLTSGLSVFTYGGTTQYCCSPEVAIRLEFSSADEAMLHLAFYRANTGGSDPGIVVSTSFTPK